MKPPERKDVLIVVGTAFFLLLCAVARAGEVNLTTGQTDYYVLVGEPAGFSILAGNTYNTTIQGVFHFTISHSQQSGGRVMHTQNSRSEHLSIPIEEIALHVDLGVQHHPGTHTFQSATFEFTGPDGIGKVVFLPDIRIHIIESQEEAKDSEPGESSTKTQDELAEERKQAEEQKAKEQEEASKRQQEQMSEASKIDNRVQNHQLNQDVQNLKKEMEEQARKDEQAMQQMKEMIESDPEFQDSMQELTQEGFAFEDADLNPDDEGRGDFSYRFMDEDGNEAEIKGSVDEEGVKDIEVSRTLSPDALMEILERDERYRRYDSALDSEGFIKDAPLLKGEEGKQMLEIEYADAKGRQASITASFEEEIVKEVMMKKQIQYWPYLAGALAGVLALLLLRKKKTQEIVPGIETVDHTGIALRMIDEAEQLFSEGKEKDAYLRVSGAIRFYLRHKNGIAAEMTNSEAMLVMRKKGKHASELKYCLDQGGLVGFARYRPNRSGFDKMVASARDIIRRM